MITYLKHMGKYTHQQLKNKTYEEIQDLYEKEKRWIDDFQPMDTKTIKDSEKKVDSSSKPAGGSRKKTLARKRTCEKKSKEIAKKQKLEDVVKEQESAKMESLQAVETLQWENILIVGSSSNSGNHSTNSGNPLAFYSQQEDLEQIDPDDLEEMDLQWEMAMLTIMLGCLSYYCQFYFTTAGSRLILLLKTDEID
ncbi:hypothetical protein Tco_0474253 [Tanacetum coccineum]